MAGPKLSVLMAAHDAAAFVDQALDDLLAQSFADFELVLVEDGSTDGTREILRARAARDPRIVLIENPANMGLPASLNRGLARCRAPIVARADADDRYPPHRLERQFRFLEANPEIGLVSCAVEKIDAEGNYLLTTRFPTEDGEIRLRELFLNSFSHPGVMFRRDLVLGVGGYDPDYPTSQDADLWARLRKHTKAANLDEPLVRYRKHGGASMQTRDAAARRHALAIRQRLLADYLGRPVSLAEAGAMQATFWARTEPRAGADEIQLGLAGLREVLRQATARETPRTVGYFRREVAAALLKQAHLHRAHPPRRAWLTWQAARWSPGLVAARLGTRLGTRLGGRGSGERAGDAPAR
jgi:GT2 family glycosyltransferase